MIVSLETAKNYLRVDFDDDDALIEQFISMAEQLCADTLRKELTATSLNIVAVLFAVAYLYEHREDPDMNALTRNVRYILMTDREVAF